MPSRSSFCLAIAAAVSLCGCGGGGVSDAPKTVSAKGIVTYNGNPLANYSVAFVPEEEGMLASGTTDSAGRFTLTTSETGDGAVPGQYKVAISIVADEAPPMPGFPEAKDYKPPVSPIPKKYTDANTSGLLFTVEKDASKNDFKIELPD